MATNTNGTPAETNGGIDTNALAQAIGAALSAQLATALKPIGDAVASQGAAIAKLAEVKPADGKPEQPKPAEGTAKPLTLEDVQRVFRESVAAQAQAAAAAQQRDTFIGTNLGKLPKAYQAQLGTDPTKWDAEAKAIQAQFEADFKGQGGTVPNVGGAAQDGGTGAGQQPQDFSKRDGFELLSEAVAEQTAQRPPAPASTTTTTTPTK